MIPDFEPEMVWPDEEEEPYQVLPIGVHETDMAEIDSTLVQKFQTSQTRSSILGRFSQLHQDVGAQGIHFCQWVTGSFVTSKENPHDVDVMTLAHRDVLKSLPPTALQFISQWLNARDGSAKDKYGAHTFFQPYFPPDDPQYASMKERLLAWQDFWCKTRKIKEDVQKADGTVVPAGTEYPKGILCVRAEEDVVIPSIH